MRCSFCKVCLEEVVGSDPDDEELLHEFQDGCLVVIDAFEKNRLAAKGNPRIRKPGTSHSGFTGDLVRVVEMGVDKQRMKSSEETCQFRCDALRQGAGRPGADPYDFHVRDRPKLRQDAVEF